MKAELIPENGDPPIPILKDLTVIGRKPFCDVVINHHSLSKRHCVIVKTDGLLVIRDLATTNGTKVKGQRIRWAALLPDDRITLGAIKFRVYLGSDDMPSPSQLTGQAKPATHRARPATQKLAPPAVETGFPSPSPLEVAIPEDLEFIDDDLEIIDDNEVSGDSGWRKFIPNSGKLRDEDEDDEPIIELE